MNNKKNNKEKKLVRGSIRAVKHPEFYEKTRRVVVISSGDIKAEIIPACLTKNLEKILQLHKIEWVSEERGFGSIKEIEGIALDRIIEGDKDHVRIEFSGQTEFELQEKMKAITAWLDANGIPHEEEGRGDSQS